MLRCKYSAYFLDVPHNSWVQLMAVWLVVVLALFPCLSDATWCYVYSKRDHPGCWRWVDDATIGIRGVSTGVISCTDTYHRSPVPFLLSQPSPNVCPDDNARTSPGTSTTSISSEEATFTSNGNTTNGEPASTATPTSTFSEDSSTTSPRTSAATRATDGETSTSIRSTTVGNTTATAIPTTACSEDSSTTGPEATTTTRPTDGETSTSIPRTTNGEPISTEAPTPAYSEACGRSYFHGTTDLNYWFRYIGIPPSLFEPTLTVEFEVKASQDVHVALAPTTDSTQELYQVVIGGSSNSAAFIKRAMFATRLVSVNIKKPLNETVFRGFWINYNATSGRIAVGKDNEENHFIEWTDPSPLNVTYVGYATSSNSEGEWRFCDF